MGKSKPGKTNFFEFDNADKAIPDYAITFKKVVCNYIRPKQIDILVMKTVLTGVSGEDVRVFGVSPSILGAAEVYAKKSFRDLAQPMTDALFPVANAIFSSLALV